MSKNEDVLIFKNELGKEVKVVFSERKMEGMKGSKNEKIEYKGVHIKLTSVDHNLETSLTKKELDKIRFHASKYLKVVGKKSEV